MTAGTVVAAICATVTDLRWLAPAVTLVWLALALTVAIWLRGAVRAVSLIVAILVALAIQSLPALLGALGVSWGCP